MLRYPQDFSKREYIDFLTTHFKNKFPFFTHPQIAIPIVEIVNDITMLLFESYKDALSDNNKYEWFMRNIELLKRILNVSPEEFPKIRYTYTYPSLFIALNTLYNDPILPINDLYKDSVHNVALWLVREGECLDFLTVHENVYKTFLREMIKQCVTEMAAVAEANIPYEIKQKHAKSIKTAQSHEKSTNEDNSKKEISWDSSHDKTTPVPSRKRERHSYDKIDKETKKQKKSKYLEELKKDKISSDEKYQYFQAQFNALYGCDIYSCCNKPGGCYRYQRALGEMYQNGNGSLTKNYFLAKFWYEKAAHQGEEGAKVLLKKLSPTPYYPKQNSRFWQPIVAMPAESSQQGESQKTEIVEKSLTFTPL